MLGKRAIDALGVKCSNAECEWEGTIGNLEKHVATCQFTLLPCPKKCSDNNYMTKCFMKKDLDDHLENGCSNRDYECEYCGEEGTYKEITKIHDEICKEKMIPCPNAECAQVMPRREVEAHAENECGHTVIPCKYESIGCDVTMKRRDMAAHEQDDKQLHLDSAMKTTLQLKSDVDNLKKDLQTGTDKIDDLISEKTITLKSEESITFALAQFQQKIDEDEVFLSPPFYTHPRGYYMIVNVSTDGCCDGEDSYVSVHVYVLEGKYDSELEWPFVGDITITLLNQLEDDHHHSKTIHLTAEKNVIIGRYKGFRRFISHTKLDYRRYFNRQYLKNDTLYFRVSVDMADHKPWLDCTTEK